MKLVNSKFYNKKNDIMGGRILKEEIPATLAVVREILHNVGIQLELPIEQCLLGSTGKKESSGDIDIGVLPFGSAPTFALKQHHEVLKVSRAGAVVSLIVGIQGGSPDPSCERNGLVQVDLIPGDLKWLKQFFYADQFSAFKGAHRNLLISAYLMSFRKDTYRDDWDVWERSTGPIFSQNHGIVDRELIRQANKSGKPYATKFTETYSDKCFDITAAAQYFFGSCYADAFTSVETLYRAIEDNYDRDFCSAVYRRFFVDYLPPHLADPSYPWELVPNLANARE